MSCHGTPGNSAVTSLACAVTSTSSDEVSRRFHDLKREAPDGAPEPSQQEVLDWLERQRLAVRTEEGLSAWRRERLLERLARAREEAEAGVLPDGRTWHAWQSLRAACDDAHTHAWLAAQAGMTLPLAELPPKDIDERLGELWEQIYSQQQRKEILARDLERARADIGRYGITEQDIAHRQQALDQVEARIDKLLDATEPLEAEYRRRKGWARYYRVITSGQGHVHASRDCHSCYPTTQYGWLPSLSGKGQDEAVDDYGSEMCSHCFPSVLDHPSYRTRGRVAEEVAQRRAEENAARQAARAEKGITNPDGSSVTLGRGRYPERINSAVTAERTLVSRMADLRRSYTDEAIEAAVAERAASGGGRPADEYRQFLLGRRDEYREHVEVLAAALAHKRGVSAEELLASLAEKAEKRAAKEAREAARARLQHGG